LEKQNQGKSFDQILLEAIDEALLSLGKSVKASIYFHLEDLFKINRSEIPNRLSDFSSALEQIFGLGARSLEILFMKNLHAKIEITLTWPTDEQSPSKWVVPEVTFQEYVRLMRQSFEAAKNSEVEIGVLLNEHEALQK
jgi:hypothetical protein